MPSQYHMAGSTLLLGTLLLIRCVLSKDPSLCEAGTYPDSVVGRCEDCRPRCRYKDDLPQECRDTCNLQEVPKCQAATYFDSVVGRCEDCHQLCPHQSMQDIPSECSDTCNPQVSTPVSVSKYSSSLSDGEVGVIILMVAVVVIALGGIPVLMYEPNIIPCKKPLKFPQQVSEDPEEDTAMRPELGAQNIV